MLNKQIHVATWEPIYQQMKERQLSSRQLITGFSQRHRKCKFYSSHGRAVGATDHLGGVAQKEMLEQVSKKGEDQDSTAKATGAAKRWKSANSAMVSAMEFT